VALTTSVGCRNVIPEFSRDGSHIAFQSCRGRGGIAQQIWMMRSDGTDRQQLTFGTVGSIPSWFPDGRHVLFGSILSPHAGGLFSVDVETHQQQLIAALQYDAGKFVMSPDGKQVALSVTKDGRVNTWLLDVATKQIRQLTFDKEMIGFPEWSPDGKLLAAEMSRGKDTNIVILPSSGGTPTQITFDHGNDWPDSWSPDGDKIVFAKQQEDGFWNVWTVSRSTKIEKQLTHYDRVTSYVRYPAMSPRGDQIVYEYDETTGNIWMLELK
jgi:TolB protein